MICYWQQVKLYVDVCGVEDVDAWLNLYAAEEPMIDRTGIGYRRLFHELRDFERNQCRCVRKKSTHIEARAIEILLPEQFQKDTFKTFIKNFMKEVLGEEKLPYCAWLVTKGKGRYLEVLVSERMYSEEEITYVQKWANSRYQNKKTGRLCKADDPDAVEIVKAGDIRRTYTGHFSLKSRIFTADAWARKNINKAERIGFKRFISSIRQKLAYCLMKAAVFFEKHVWIPKKKRFDFMNRYQQTNVIRINEMIKCIEERLEDLWQVLICPAKFIDESKNLDRFNTLYFHYKNIFKSGRFTYSCGAKRPIKLAFSPYQNVVRCGENLDTLKEMFEEDMKLTFERMF